MAEDIGERLERAIRQEDEKTRRRLRAAHAKARPAEQAFAPVREAAEALREKLRDVPSIEFAIAPDSVWITFADREVWFGFDADSEKFLGEESAHSWYDGEPYAERYQWDSADDCIEALIRICARYVRMDRAIRSALEEG